MKYLRKSFSHMKYLKLFEALRPHLGIQYDETHPIEDICDHVYDIFQDIEDDGFGIDVSPSGDRFYIGIMREELFTYNDIKNSVDHVISYLEENDLVIYQFIITATLAPLPEWLRGCDDSLSRTLKDKRNKLKDSSIQQIAGEMIFTKLEYLESDPNLTISRYLKLYFEKK